MSPRRRLLIIACLALAVMGYAVLHWKIGAGRSASEAHLWSTLYMQLLWVLIAVGAAARLRGPVGDRLGLRRGDMGIGPLVLAALGMVCLSNAANLALVGLDLRESAHLARIDRVVSDARSVAPGLTLLAMGIAPGVGEEILFRGLLQRSLAKRVRPLIAVFLTAGLFGLIHLDPAHSTVAFVLGSYLGLVAMVSRNVWAAVLCHTVNNSVAVATGLTSTPLPGIGTAASSASWLVAAALLLVGAIRWTMRRRAPSPAT